MSESDGGDIIFANFGEHERGRADKGMTQEAIMLAGVRAARTAEYQLGTVFKPYLFQGELLPQSVKNSKYAMDMLRDMHSVGKNYETEEGSHRFVINWATNTDALARAAELSFEFVDDEDIQLSKVAGRFFTACEDISKVVASHLQPERKETQFTHAKWLAKIRELHALLDPIASFEAERQFGDEIRSRAKYSNSIARARFAYGLQQRLAAGQLSQIFEIDESETDKFLEKYRNERFREACLTIKNGHRGCRGEDPNSFYNQLAAATAYSTQDELASVIREAASRLDLYEG